MPIRTRALLTASALLLSAAAASAQTKPVTGQAKMDHGKMEHGKMEHGKMEHGKDAGAMNHAASGWKELDAYHTFMMATWHPAKGSNDLKPFRAKAGEMAASARILAASTPPKACDTPVLRKAAADLAPATADAAALVATGTDAELKTALAALHERFEVIEHGCSADKH